ncbi:hypothetical protein EBESD8_4510 [Rhodococcus aetherivorans]|nr:hypothetical protein EBESD8_4510 [Rhodococcus aetherivorans]
MRPDRFRLAARREVRAVRSATSVPVPYRSSARTTIPSWSL